MLVFYVLVFFFKLYGNLRERNVRTHSSPTRRSSDLDARPGGMVGRAVENALGEAGRRRARRVDVGLGIAEAIAGADVEPRDAAREGRAGVKGIDVGDEIGRAHV